MIQSKGRRFEIKLLSLSKEDQKFIAERLLMNELWEWQGTRGK